MVMLVRLVQTAKAPSPMLVTLSGMAILVRLSAGTKGRTPDAGDAVRDNNTGQTGAVIKGTHPDAGDRLAFNRIWNHQLA